MNGWLRGRRQGRTALLGALLCGVLALSGCSVYNMPLPGGASTGSNPITLHIKFRDVLDLVPKSAVRVDDVEVGKVTDVQLQGYVADVTVQVPRSVKLPANSRAEIRQTSLLGEKFVSLERATPAAGGLLKSGDTIPLARSGRNPEVEEVLQALSALLNGGGVGQLKTIASNLNTALGGREDQVRSVLDQIKLFMGQLDKNKETIVSALVNLNRLAVQLRKQDPSIKSALDNLPAALSSINRQRDDLRRMLAALSRLSGVGVRVIRASKTATIDGLRDLVPILNNFAAAGQSLPRSLQVFLTYPFVDAAVGTSPRVARNLHMGDYTNLSIRLDLNLLNPPKIPGLPNLPKPPKLPKLPKPPKQVRKVCKQLAQVVATTKARAARAADQAVSKLPTNKIITKKLKNNLREYVRTRLIDQTLAAAKRQCRAPDASRLLRDAQSIARQGLQQALKSLNLTPTQIRRLLNGITPQPIKDLLKKPGSNPLPNPLPSTLQKVTGGALRAEPGPAFQHRRAVYDPLQLAPRGLDPGIGTLLFQGVAAK